MGLCLLNVLKEQLMAVTYPNTLTKVSEIAHHDEEGLCLHGLKKCFFM